MDGSDVDFEADAGERSRWKEEEEMEAGGGDGDFHGAAAREKRWDKKIVATIAFALPWHFYLTLPEKYILDKSWLMANVISSKLMMFRV